MIGDLLVMHKAEGVMIEMLGLTLKSCDVMMDASFDDE